MVSLNKRNLQKQIQILFLFASLPLLGECNRSADTPAIAHVGRAVLTTEMIDQAIGQHLLGVDSTKLKRDFINRWIEQELLYQAAINGGFYETDRIRKELQRIQRQLVIENYLERAIEPRLACTEQEIQEFYHKNIDDFIAEETTYSVQDIVVKTSKEAQIVDSQLKKGIAFEEIKSENLEISVGFLSFINTPIAEGQIPSPFREVIKKLNNGETSKQISYEKEYHFIKLLDKVGKGKALPLNLVRQQVVERLHVQKSKEEYNQLLKKLRDDKDVVVNFAPVDIASSKQSEQDSAATTRDSSTHKP